jgi:anti-sigma regulatory factor (Ser/Thr protein kinase)
MPYPNPAHTNGAGDARRAARAAPDRSGHDDVSVRLVLPAEPENVGIVRHALAGVGSALRLEGERLSAVRLAVTEACTNVVRHAYGGDPGPLEVDVRAREDALEVDVRDRGTGIAPRPSETSLGLGLPLIAALADRMRIRRDPDGSTVISMAFRR